MLIPGQAMLMRGKNRRVDGAGRKRILTAAGPGGFLRQPVHFISNGLIKSALGFPGLLPAEHADDILKDFAGALINTGYFYIPLDLFDPELNDIAISSECLHGIIGSRVSGFRRKQLGDGAFNLQVGLSGI